MLNTLQTLFENKVLYYGVLLSGIMLFSIVIIVFILKRNRSKKLEKTVLIKKIDSKSSNDEQNVEYLNNEDNEKTQAKLELQKMLEQMQDDLDNKMEQAVSNFEQEQEEKAIISYQELLKSAKKDSNLEVIPITTEKMIEDSKKLEKYSFSASDNENKKFKSTEFISPIFGVLENKSKFPHIPRIEREEENIQKNVVEEIIDKPVIEEVIKKPAIEKREIENFSLRRERRLSDEDLPYNDKTYDLEETLNLGPINEEIKKNEEFLRTLKEFRKNL